MFKKSISNFLVAALIVLAFSLAGYAAPSDVPSSQTAGGLEQQQSTIKKGKELEQGVTQEKPASDIKEKSTETVAPLSQEKVLVKQFKVEGSSLLPEATILATTAPFENKELTFGEIKKVADLLTDAYRSLGYPTSRAYIPSQEIGENGMVLIRVLEGTVGEVTITGNKYFDKSVYLKKLGLVRGEAFNYSALQESLSYINERPDRFAKAVLVPGKNPGETDVMIEVKDSVPVHVGYTHDNYSSRYNGRQRDSVTLEHNNLLGLDDQLYLQFLRSNHALGTMYAGRYLFPVNKTLNFGVNGSYAKSKLGREFAVLNVVGKSTVGGVFVNKALISKSDLDLRLNAGFDYKKIRNSILGVEQSRDDARVAKVGIDVDKTDSLGRTLFTAEFDQGIPDIWGGLEAKDSRASRVGAGGKFSKGLFNLYRAQPLPFDTALLFKNSAQFTNHALTSAEEFEVGGPYSVRGYGPGEYAGDRGLYSSIELTVPYYFIPKEWTLPRVKETWYDSTRLVLFYDWGTTRLNNAQSGEAKSRTLDACGFGFRFNLTNRITAKAEFGYPLGGPKSSDSKRQNVQPWFEVSIKY